MRQLRLLFVAALTVLVAPSRTSAQEKPPAKDTTVAVPVWRLRIMGIYDDRTGEPVEGADVTDVMNGTTARTTSTGTVSLVFLPEGGGLVRIRKIGYEVQTMMVSIAPADSLPITVILKKVVELAAMAVVDSSPHYFSSKLQGFEERRKNAAAGQFIPEALIRKDESRRIGEFLRVNLSNAVLRDGRGGTVYMMPSMRCGRGGPPAVYLDGALMSGERQGAPVNLSEINLSDLAGVEYYPNTATAPPQYNGTASSCGALLLWTREK